MKTPNHGKNTAYIYCVTKKECNLCISKKQKTLFNLITGVFLYTIKHNWGGHHFEHHSWVNLPGITFLISTQLQYIYVFKKLYICNFLILHERWLFLFLYFWLPAGEVSRAAQSHAKASKEGNDCLSVCSKLPHYSRRSALVTKGAARMCLQQMIQSLLKYSSWTQPHTCQAQMPEKLSQLGGEKDCIPVWTAPSLPHHPSPLLFNPSCCISCSEPGALMCGH